MESVSFKAPGKILWLGGYSVVERPNTSLVSTVNAYVTASLKIRKDNVIGFDSPQLNAGVKGDLGPDGRIAANTPNELILFKTAAEVALRYISGIGVRISGFNITTKSDSAFSYSLASTKVVKSGLGSSAAVTVAAVGAILRAFEVDPKENDALHKLSQIAHSIATGRVGSGFDIAAATYGSILYTRYSSNILDSLPGDYSNDDLCVMVKKRWDYSIEEFSLPEQFRLLFANFGESMITTKALGSMSDFKLKDPGTYKNLIKGINDENARAIDALRKINKGDEGALDSFRESFDNGRELTKRLGILSGVDIEPDDCTKLIEESRKNGAFVSKLPGAGGKDAIAALSLSDKDAELLRNFWRSRHSLKILDIRLVDRFHQL